MEIQRRTGTLVLLLLAALARVATAQQAEELDTVRVSDRKPRTLVSTARHVVVIDRDQIKGAGSSTLAELLDQVAGVDIRERGPGGVQADVSLRAGTFEQTLVMVDGIAVMDPQTGHHALNLPMSLEDIERIEILEGQGARAFGPNAIGGVINVVTRRPEGAKTGATVITGQNTLLGGAISATVPTFSFAHRAGAGRWMHDGYRFNTDADVQYANYRGSGTIASIPFDAFVGFTEKDFGANGFYSDRYPKQREKTTAILSALSSRFSIGPVSLSPAVQWRRHHDDFVLRYDDPSFYQNITRTDVVSARLHGLLPNPAGELRMGLDGVFEYMENEDLGDRHRYRGSLYLEHHFRLADRLDIVPGVTVSYADRLGWPLWPGLDIGYDFLDTLRLFASVDYSYRLPTFTDLYYESPANLGDPELDHERALSYEGGARFHNRILSADIVGYRREGWDIIDWVRDRDFDQWVVTNLSEVDVTGLRASATVRLRGPFARLPIILKAGYAFANVTRHDNALRTRYASTLPDTVDPETLEIEYKYSAEYLRHKATFSVDHSLIAALRFRWQTRLEERVGENGVLLFDGRMYIETPRFGLFAEATNLFDRRYEDYAGVPMPGRWLRAGVSVRLRRKEASESRRSVLGM